MARPKKSEAKDTRALAIEAADALLHQYGYQGFSMDDVAAAIGVRKASLYHHFPQGKEQLVREMADQMMTDDEYGIRRACESARTAKGRLQAIARYAFRQRRDGARVLRDALRFMHPTHQEQVYTRYRATQFDQVHAVILAGVASKELRKHNTFLSTSAFMGLLSEMGETEGFEPEALAAEVANMFVKGLHS